MSNTTDKIIGEIKSDLKVLLSRFDEFSKNTEKRFDQLDVRMDKYEEDMVNVKMKQSSLDTKLSVMSIFQLAFSSVLTAVATLLGKRI